MKDQIEAILSGEKDKCIKQVGPFWQIRVGARAGARKDGVSLARDLLREHREDVGEVAPVSMPPLVDIPIPEFLFEADPRDAEIAALKAELERAKAHIETVENTPPADLADLIEVADTPIETNDKLLARLREVLGLIGLAEDAGGRAAPELYRRRDRLESGVRWNRGRMAEQL
jgi:hypothetical protein